MRVVYLDTLFFLNFLTDYFLLLLTARVGGRYPRRRRLALGAAVGAALAVALYFPPASLAAGWLLRALTCAGAVIAAFSGEPKSCWPRLCGIFVLLTVGLAGILLGLTLLGGRGISLQNGVPYIAISWPVLLVGFTVLYLLSGWVLGKGRGSTGRRTHEIQAALGDRQAQFRALEDSGNLLRDPVTGKKILVAQYEALSGIFGSDLEPLLAQSQPDQALVWLRQRWETAFWLVPAQTAAQSFILPVFSPEKLWVDGVIREDYLLGITTQRLKIGGDCRGLIGV